MAPPKISAVDESKIHLRMAGSNDVIVSTETFIDGNIQWDADKAPEFIIPRDEKRVKAVLDLGAKLKKTYPPVNKQDFSEEQYLQEVEKRERFITSALTAEIRNQFKGYNPGTAAEIAVSDAKAKLAQLREANPNAKERIAAAQKTLDQAQKALDTLSEGRTDGFTHNDAKRQHDDKPASIAEFGDGELVCRHTAFLLAMGCHEADLKTCVVLGHMCGTEDVQTGGHAWVISRETANVFESTASPEHVFRKNVSGITLADNLAGHPTVVADNHGGLSAYGTDMVRSSVTRDANILEAVHDPSRLAEFYKARIIHVREANKSLEAGDLEGVLFSARSLPNPFNMRNSRGETLTDLYNALDDKSQISRYRLEDLITATISTSNSQMFAQLHKDHSKGALAAKFKEALTEEHYLMLVGKAEVITMPQFKTWLEKDTQEDIGYERRTKADKAFAQACLPWFEQVLPDASGKLLENAVSKNDERMVDLMLKFNRHQAEAGRSKPYSPTKLMELADSIQVSVHTPTGDKELDESMPGKKSNMMYSFVTNGLNPTGLLHAGLSEAEYDTRLRGLKVPLMHQAAISGDLAIIDMLRKRPMLPGGDIKEGTLFDDSLTDETYVDAVRTYANARDGGVKARAQKIIELMDASSSGMIGFAATSSCWKNNTDGLVLLLDKHPRSDPATGKCALTQEQLDRVAKSLHFTPASPSDDPAEHEKRRANNVAAMKLLAAHGGKVPQEYYDYRKSQYDAMTEKSSAARLLATEIEKATLTPPNNTNEQRIELFFDHYDKAVKGRQNNPEHGLHYFLEIEAALVAKQHGAQQKTAVPDETPKEKDKPKMPLRGDFPDETKDRRRTEVTPAGPDNDALKQAVALFKSGHNPTKPESGEVETPAVAGLSKPNLIG